MVPVEGTLKWRSIGLSSLDATQPTPPSYSDVKPGEYPFKRGGSTFTLRPRLSFPLLDAFLDQFQS